MSGDESRDLPRPVRRVDGAFSALQTMKEKFAEFRAEVRRGQEDAAAQALKRALREAGFGDIQQPVAVRANCCCTHAHPAYNS